MARDVGVWTATTALFAWSMCAAVACATGGRTVATDAGPCKADQDCQRTKFCDRGACVAPDVESQSHYGRDCDESVHPLDGLTSMVAKFQVCGPYICSDSRCRSCSSDAECQTILGSPACYRLKGWPGKSCGVGPE
jgi:hypothetical protein